MSQGQATSEATKEKAVAPAVEANLAGEQEEQAAVDVDTLNSAPEADGDIDLAFDEEVGFLRSMAQPAQMTICLGMLFSLAWISACRYFDWSTAPYRSCWTSPHQVSHYRYVCFREMRMKMCYTKTLMMRPPCGSLRPWVRANDVVFRMLRCLETPMKDMRHLSCVAD